MKKNVIVGQSGVPTAVINASLAGVYKTAKDMGADTIYGMRYGIQGLLEKKIVNLGEKIRNDKSVAPVAMGVIIFIAVCAFGKNQPHRSFMHSIMAMAILSGALSMVSVQMVPYFVVGFASHLVLDCFNRKRVRILYPLPGGIALDFCKAGGFVDSLLFKLGSVAVIFEIVYLAVRMGESWKFFQM
mgnify:FL=1